MVVTNDADRMVESDHLDKLIQRPVPVQPVVVVQYRNRGLSLRLVVPFVFVVTLTAFYVYHRTVSERYCIQAVHDR